MKKLYEAPELEQIAFSVEEALMASILDPSEGGDAVEIGPSIPLF